MAPVIAGAPALTVTVELFVPVLPATSRNPNVTDVLPRGNSVVLSAVPPPESCGASRAGAGSRLSVAVPPARKVASADEALPRAPPASVGATVIAAGAVTTGGVLSRRTANGVTGSLLPALSCAL